MAAKTVKAAKAAEKEQLRYKPTREQIEALQKKGLTLKQIGGIYGYTSNQISNFKQRGKDRSKPPDVIWKIPVSKEEWERARMECRVGDSVRVFNHWRADLSAERWSGKVEISKIKQKFPYIVLLENGRTVDYAEIARQRREENGFPLPPASEQGCGPEREML